MQAPVLLALDSATETWLVGLAVDGVPRVRWGSPGPQASSQLLPAAQALLAQAGLDWPAVQAIGFGRGPGAFTGLRTACAVAQGLALVLACPLVPVDNLLLIAQAAREACGPQQPPETAFASTTAGWEVAVAQDARMGELYAARYRHDGHAWHTLDEPALWSAAQLAQAWRTLPGGAPRVGTGWGLLQAAGLELGPTDPAAALADEGARRARALLELTHRGWERGQTVLPEDAQPLYLRNKVAQTTAERAAQAMASGAAGAWEPSHGKS
jgi:tRNA threonylcarbamoyladenosine biosynthesis protein TsaB